MKLALHLGSSRSGALAGLDVRATCQQYWIGLWGLLCLTTRVLELLYSIFKFRLQMESQFLQLQIHPLLQRIVTEAKAKIAARTTV